MLLLSCVVAAIANAVAVLVAVGATVAIAKSNLPLFIDTLFDDC